MFPYHNVAYASKATAQVALNWGLRPAIMRQEET
jgi:hypothetical protein